MNYMFPATKWAKKITNLTAQANAIAEEFGEFFDECRGSEEETVELLDVIHACETYLRILEARGCDVNKAYARVVVKNADRGYYNE